MCFSPEPRRLRIQTHTGGGGPVQQTNEQTLTGRSLAIPLSRVRGTGKTLCASTQENELLRTSLLKAQTDVAVLHSELDKLKNMYADQRAQHER